jgi:hypothetical protein
MANDRSSTTTLELDIPTYLPLSEAADTYKLSENVLTQLIQTGKIEAVRLPSGELLVPASNGSDLRSKHNVINQKFRDLCGKPITVTEAAEKYDLHRDTVLEWKKREYITVLKSGYRMELDEAEVAYCAEIYHQRQTTGGTRGVPLLDENGLPYQLKYPDLAKRRRYQRHKKNK